MNAAMVAINTKRANNNDDIYIPEDPMGPAMEEELSTSSVFALVIKLLSLF